MSARNHHYLSQFYLKGFSKAVSKNSKISVVDVRDKRQFETIARNIGALRDFNRIEVEGVDPNLLEKSLAEFESDAAGALKRVEHSAVFEENDKELILNLISMFAIRSPQVRDQLTGFHEQLAERMLDIALATKQRWESQLREMKARGGDEYNEISYEDVKEFYDEKKYKIQVSRDHLIRLEIVGINAILPYLRSRNWLLIRADEETGPFITTDNPVNLTWKVPDEIPVMYRDSPGYAMTDTQVYFPISKDLAIIGEFNGPSATIDATKELVALLNGRLIRFAYRQIYAPKMGFYFCLRPGEILDGRKLLKGDLRVN